MKLAIAIPTYNEAANIKKLLPAIKENLSNESSVDCTVFVIDDNSPDGTADISDKVGKKLKATKFNVKVIRRKKKEGLGRAYIYAFHAILALDYDYILQMDADLSHDPKYIPQFLQATEDCDFVVGSRYVKGGATPDWSWNRKLLSRAGNIYTKTILSSKISDYTGGYNLFSAALLHKINLDTLQAGGYGFLIELKYKALENCHNVAQVPIVFMDRQHGDSKLPRGIIIKNILLVMKVRFSRVFTAANT
jgi:dolichol-phosphate mannosyltransferase